MNACMYAWCYCTMAYGVILPWHMNVFSYALVSGYLYGWYDSTLGPVSQDHYMLGSIFGSAKRFLNRFLLSFILD